MCASIYICACVCVCVMVYINVSGARSLNGLDVLYPLVTWMGHVAQVPWLWWTNEYWQWGVLSRVHCRIHSKPSWHTWKRLMRDRRVDEKPLGCVKGQWPDSLWSCLHVGAFYDGSDSESGIIRTTGHYRIGKWVHAEAFYDGSDSESGIIRNLGPLAPTG